MKKKFDHLINDGVQHVADQVGATPQTEDERRAAEGAPRKKMSKQARAWITVAVIGSVLIGGGIPAGFAVADNLHVAAAAQVNKTAIADTHDRADIGEVKRSIRDFTVVYADIPKIVDGAVQPVIVTAFQDGLNEANAALETSDLAGLNRAYDRMYRQMVAIVDAVRYRAMSSEKSSPDVPQEKVSKMVNAAAKLDGATPETEALHAWLEETAKARKVVVEIQRAANQQHQAEKKAAAEKAAAGKKAADEKAFQDKVDAAVKAKLDKAIADAKALWEVEQDDEQEPTVVKPKPVVKPVPTPTPTPTPTEAPEVQGE